MVDCPVTISGPSCRAIFHCVEWLENDGQLRWVCLLHDLLLECHHWSRLLAAVKHRSFYSCQKSIPLSAGRQHMEMYWVTAEGTVAKGPSTVPFSYWK